MSVTERGDILSVPKWMCNSDNLQVSDWITALVQDRHGRANHCIDHFSAPSALPIWSGFPFGWSNLPAYFVHW